MHFICCRCKRQCTSKFTSEEKLAIISKLYAGQPKNEQDTFLMGCIESKPCERKRKRSVESNVSKNNTFLYFAYKESKRVPICKMAYMSLYALSQHRVQRLKEILVSGDSPYDMRGRHHTRPHVYPPDVIIKIKQHIESFPTNISHYSSRKVTYLDAKLTVKTMHSLFIKLYPDL